MQLEAFEIEESYTTGVTKLSKMSGECYKAKVLKTVAFLCCLLSSAILFADSVIWGSGTIVLPNGCIASDGDVTGYALICNDVWTQLELYETSSSYFYQKIYNGTLQPPKSGLWWISTGTSAEDGTLDLTDGLSTLSASRKMNEWAVVIYTCVENGLEYYKRVNASHYASASSNQAINMNYYNLASQSDWVKGYELVPEPSSSVLLLVGVCCLA